MVERNPHNKMPEERDNTAEIKARLDSVVERHHKQLGLKQEEKNKLETVDTEGYIDRGEGALGITNRRLDRLGGFLRRHPLAQRVAAGAAFIGGIGSVSAGVAGCGPDKKESTTVPPGITSTQVPGTESTEPGPTSSSIPFASTTEKKKTTTSKAPTTTQKETTTTEALTTTTTESKVGINPEFISTERTIDDVTGKIELGEKTLTKPVGEVPVDLQKLFQSKNPGKKILYVGKANQGDKMNAVITDKMYLFGLEAENGEGPSWAFLGGNPENPWGEYSDSATMEFLDVVLIPGSEDFYMRGQNPLTGSEMYVRISLDNEKTIDYPVVFDFDLASNAQTLPGGKTNHRTWKWFLANHELGDIIQPGHMLYIDLFAIGRGGSLDSPDSIKWDVAVDEKGVQYAIRTIFPVYNEADKAAYEKLYE